MWKALSVSQVRREYKRASKADEDYAKAKWGTHESMVNRFRLALSVVDWGKVSTWTDVGCGTGIFFKTVEEAGHRFRRMTGVELVKSLVAEARKRDYVSPVEFVVGSLDRKLSGVPASDLVTLVGVLQQCGLQPETTIRKCVQALTPGGQLFLTTKNVSWNAFTEGALEPETHHSWFAPRDIARTIEAAGARVTELGGFLPRENQRVPLDGSHTMFFLAQRNS